MFHVQFLVNPYGGGGQKSGWLGLLDRLSPHAEKKFPFGTGNQQMAGVKGKSGGPRKNAGGARPGAGRKPKAAAPEKRKKSANTRAKARVVSAVEVRLDVQPTGGALKRSKSQPVEQEDQDMLTLLQNIALGRTAATTIQVKAAIAAVQYTHVKKGEGGKKDARQQNAEKVGARFTPTAPPRARMN